MGQGHSLELYNFHYLFWLILGTTYISYRVGQRNRCEKHLFMKREISEKACGAHNLRY